MLQQGHGEVSEFNFNLQKKRLNIIVFISVKIN
jgi:hypothetical protein